MALFADSGSYSPADIERKRQLAAALMGSDYQARDPLGAIAKTLQGSIGGYENRRASEIEQQQREGFNSKLAEILSQPNVTVAQLGEAAGNPWANQSQQAILASLLAQKLTPPEPYKPNYTTFEQGGDIYRYDQNDPEAQPSLFFDGEPPKPDVPSSVEEYQFAVSQGYDKPYEQWITDKAKAGATNIDFNQNQGVAAGFADRMAAANTILNDPKLLGAMTDPVKPGLANVPVAGNYMVGPEYQMAQQAQRDFVNAILRRESGAVISPSEFENAKQQYFPQPGDSPEVIAQKAQNRAIALQGVIRGAGPNYQPPPSLAPQGAPAAVPPVSSSPTPSPPEPGTIVDGYRYKGGNPADPNSWEPV